MASPTKTINQKLPSACGRMRRILPRRSRELAEERKALLVGFAGWRALGGILVLLSIVPINDALAAKMRRARAARMPISDARVALCTEAVQAMRLIKVSGWEIVTASIGIGKGVGALRCRTPSSECWVWANLNLCDGHTAVHHRPSAAHINEKRCTI